MYHSHKKYVIFSLFSVVCFILFYNSYKNDFFVFSSWKNSV